MKKLLLCLGLCLSMTTFAQKKEWLDPELNAINRAPARADYFAYPSREMAEQGVREESSNFLSLNGMWKFNWVKDQTERPVNFYRLDFEDQYWVDFPVPGIWEMNGYGMFQVDNLLSALQCADIPLVDGRIVTEPLCRVTPDQKNVAGNVFVFLSRQIECGNSFDLRFGQINIFHFGSKYSEFSVLNRAVIMQSLFSGRPHDDFQFLDMAAYGVDRVVFGRKIGNEVIVKFDVYVIEIVTFAPCFAKLFELDNKPLVILDGGVAIPELVNVQPCAILHFTDIAGNVVGQ